MKGLESAFIVAGCLAWMPRGYPGEMPWVSVVGHDTAAFINMVTYLKAPR